MAKEKILLGMSGGVDSTYAVLELRRQGYDVVGAVLKMNDETDIARAESAAGALELPLHVIDCTERFQKEVIGDFLAEYARARTPNPCVVCNRTVKIRTLCDFARENGIPLVATGHYAGVCRDATSGRFYIARAKDLRKDQSYMLWGLSQEMLSMLRLPLSDLTKETVKAEAAARALPSAGLPESQEICFIPDNDHVGYIERALGAFPEGNFVSGAGEVLGRHRGLIRYTVGQRKGLGLSLGRPMFVCGLNAAENTVTLAEETALFRTELRCSSLRFMKRAPGDADSLSLSAKIRYAAEPAPATVSIGGDTATVHFAHPVRAVTPGQSVVFYDGDGIAFGGIIESSEK